MGGFWFADDFICVVLCRIVLVSGWFDFRGSGFGVVGVGLRFAWRTYLRGFVIIHDSCALGLRVSRWCGCRLSGDVVLCLGFWCGC